eukprot:3939387-Rhodomonas_salina.2
MPMLPERDGLPRIPNPCPAPAAPSSAPNTRASEADKQGARERGSERDRERERERLRQRASARAVSIERGEERGADRSCCGGRRGCSTRRAPPCCSAAGKCPRARLGLSGFFFGEAQYTSGLGSGHRVGGSGGDSGEWA